MPYKIEDNRELMYKWYGPHTSDPDPAMYESYGFELTYGNEYCTTTVCFPTQQEAEEYAIMKKLLGRL